MSARPTPRLPGQTGSFLILGSAAFAVVTALPDVFRAAMTPQATALLVTAVAVTILDRFPIYLDPVGELPLISVIAIPTLVLFGWPAAVVGATIGMGTGFLSRPPRDVLVRLSEEIPPIAAAAIGPAIAAMALVPEQSRAVVALIVASLTYIVLRTLTASTRMEREEAVAWPRAIRFLVAATWPHVGVFTIFAATAVWTLSGSQSSTDRVLVPLLAAAVTIQLYFPRILRGQEQRRVLAAVSVLAAAVDVKDPYTAGHSAEVARLCQRVARILGLSEREVHRVYLAALLHDVGKMVVPSTVLLKPGKLTDDEWQVMRSHVDAGVRIVETIGGLAGVAPIVAASHEQLDGRGYPRGLKGNSIPLGSRINLVVDTYNALTTDRPYRAARSREAAFRELEAHAGTQLDPRVVAALRIALGESRARLPQGETRAWATLLRQPAFALLWVGELISFVGDTVFLVAITLWVLKLTGSITMLAVSLIAATAGPGVLGFLAGALADRIDRRGLIVTSDICRAVLVAAIPFVLPSSIPAGIVILVVLNVGTVFFRTSAFALIQSIVPREALLTANALFQLTERIGEIIGGVLGGLIVAAAGYGMALYLDALSFLVSAICVGLMPVAWRAGLGMQGSRKIITEIGDGLRYIWQTPLHRAMALLILPGYLTLAFDVLQTPMVVKTAGLSMVAYGVTHSALGAGKLVSATVLSGAGRRWISVPFVASMYVLTSLATALFGATPAYAVLIGAAFLFGLGNVATYIANATISMANTPSTMIGRLMASRQVFIAVTTVIGMLVFGRMADLVGPPIALITLGLVSGAGVVIVWLLAGRQTPEGGPIQVPGGAAR